MFRSKILGLFGAALLGIGSAANASIVSYDFVSNGESYASLAIDQDFLPASLSQSRLLITFGGWSNPFDVLSVDYRSDGQVFEFDRYSLDYEPDYVPTFDIRAISDAFIPSCESMCTMQLNFNKPGDINRFRIEGLGDPTWTLITNSGIFRNDSYSNDTIRYRRQPFSAERTGEVIGALPVPLPASGALLLTGVAMLGFGRLVRRKRAVNS